MLKLKSAGTDKFDIEEVRKEYKKQLRKKELFSIFQTIRKSIASQPDFNSQPIYLQQPCQPIYFQLPPNYQQYLTYLLNLPKHSLHPHPIPIQEYSPLQIEQKEDNVYLQKNGVIIYNKLLGNGTFSKVWEGKIKKTGQKVAAKQVKKLEPNQLQCLTELTSKYIIKVIDVFAHSEKSFIILEYCETNLRDQLQNCNYKMQKILKYFEEIINGIDVLQERNIIHRDLKFENILLKDGTVKIADFGLAKFLGNELQVESRVCGTPYTMAPEIYFSATKKAPYTIKSDIWSIGVILHEMLYRIHPFESDSYYFKRQRRVRVKKRYGILDSIIDKCLVFNPVRRISWNQLKQLFTTYLQEKESTPLKQHQQPNIQVIMFNKKKQKNYEQEEIEIIKEQKQNCQLQNRNANIRTKNISQNNKVQKEVKLVEKSEEKYKLQNVKQIQSIIYEVSASNINKQPSSKKDMQVQQLQKAMQNIYIIQKEAIKGNVDNKGWNERCLNELIIVVIIVMTGVYYAAL